MAFWIGFPGNKSYWSYQLYNIRIDLEIKRENKWGRGGARERGRK